MSSLQANPRAILDSNTDSQPNHSFGGRLCKFAGLVLSFAPFMTRSLKTSVSPLVLGTALTSSLIGGEANSQSCTTSTDTPNRAFNVNCTQSSISASLEYFGGIWGGGAGSVNIALSASTSVRVATGTSAIFRFGSQGSGAINFIQAVNGQDIEAISNVPIAIEAIAPYGSSNYVDQGSTPITISVTGDISVANSSNYAVRASRTAGTGVNPSTLGTTITISTADITASGGGIWTRSKGNVSITAHNITASAKHGISINNDEADTPAAPITSLVSINVSSISVSDANAFGLNLNVRGASISANIGSITHTATGTSGIGIFNRNSQDTGDNPATFVVGSATVANKLIDFQTPKKGTVTFTSTGTVIGRSLGIIYTSGDINVNVNSFSARSGVSATSTLDLRGKNITVSTSGVITTSARAAYLLTSGNVSITVSGNMTGGHASGTIHTLATNSSARTRITISATGNIANTNTGALGAIYVIGNSGSRIDIKTKNVTNSGFYAINVELYNGTANITISGEVKATSTADRRVSAIRIDNSLPHFTGAPRASIVLNSGAVLGASGEDAVFITGDDFAAFVNTTITVNSGASLVGGVGLHRGNDELKFNGGSYTLGTGQTIDGGTWNNDNDTLNFNSGNWTVTASNFRNWETLKIGTAATTKFLSSKDSNDNLVHQSLAFDSVVVDGVLSLQDGEVKEVLNISGGLSGSGVIHVDVNFVTKTADQVVVGGNVPSTAAIKIRLNDVTPSGTAHVVDTKTRILTLNGTNVATSVFTLENGVFFAGGYKYTIFVADSKHIELQSAPALLRCIESSSNVGVFTCSGSIAETESILKVGTTNISATLDATASVSVSSNVAFDVRGANGISFTQAASGGALTGSGSATGLVHAQTTGNGVVTVQLTGTASLSGSGTAVLAKSTGTGTVMVDTFAVSATDSAATAVHAEGAGANVTVTSSGTISGGRYGIIAKNTGSTGLVTVTTTAPVSVTDTSSGKSAIYVHGLGRGVTVNVSSTGTGDAVTGVETGILAVNNNTGESLVTINVTGNVSATKGDAIHVTNSSNGGVTVNISGNITGGKEAVDVRNEKGGNISITATGRLVGTGEAAPGVHPADGLTAVDNGTGSVTVSVQNAKGVDDGVDARNYGGGSITVTVTGDAEGAGEDESDAGIHVFGDSDGESVSVNLVTGASSKGAYGIYIRSHGSGGVTLNATGNVEGLYYDGVYVRNSGSTITVNVKDVEAYEDGVDVRPRGTGNTTITQASGGSIIADGGENSYGVYVVGRDSGDITLSMFGDVYGYDRGVYVDNSGAGDVLITIGSDGSSEGSEKEGIYLKNRSGAGDASVTVSGEVIGKSHGVRITNSGSGAVTVLGSGTITSSEGEGILVTNSGGAVSVGGGTITGKTEGVEVANTGSGTISLDVTTVTADNEGVLVTNSGSGNVSASVTNVTSKSNAVVVNNLGAGSVTFTSTGSISTTVSATSFTGVDVTNSGTGLSVTVMNVAATEHGVDAENLGSGATSVTVNGAIVLSGSSAKRGVNLTGATAASSSVTLNSAASITGGEVGIYAKARTTESVSVVTSGSVSASVRGIVASNEGIGDVDVTIDGNVTGGSGLTDTAISTLTQGGSATITINSGIITGKTALQGDESVSNVILNASGELKGDVKLSGGVDQMTINGGKFDKSVILDGGTDIGTDSSVDILTFTTGSATFEASNLTNWEKIVISAGATLHTENSDVLNVTELDMGTGGILSLSQGTEGSADDAITIGGNLVGSGILKLDVNFAKESASSDTVTIRGNVSGQHKIRLTSVTPSGVDLAEGPITVATVEGTATANSIILENTSYGALGFVYTLSFDATNKRFSLSGLRGTLRCTESSNTTGLFTCGGAIATPESISRVDSTDISATLASTATVETETGVAFSVQGGGNVTFKQEDGGGAITAGGTASGVVRATSTGNGNVSIDLFATATQAGSGTAIFASTVGTGTIAVNVAAVTASHTGATAIHVSGKGASVAVAAGAVTGGQAGVVVKNTNATGTVTVALTGAVTSSSGAAIDVEGKGLTVSVTASSTVSALTTGVKVANTGSGSGAVSVTVAGAVTATNSTGMEVSNSATGDIEITAASVTGSGLGITAKNANGGNIVLAVTGNVSASGETEEHAGIYVSNDARGNTVTLNASGASGGVGVHVMNEGAGGVTVTVSGAVTGTVGDGISVSNSGTTTSITAGSITAKTDGIDLRGNGSGDESITVVSGSTITAEAHGINFKMVDGGDATVTILGTISAEMKGLYIDNTTGTGDVSVTVASGASISGTHGIHVMTLSAAGATSLTVNGAVSGTTSGIHFVDATDSSVTISGTGSVTSETGAAIFVSATRSGGVSVGIGSATSSGASGIDVRNVGTENLSIASTGLVTGSGTEGIGINAHNGATGTDLTVSAAGVTGVSGGVIVVNEGSGATSVAATGLVTASAGDGINVDSKASTTGLTVSTTGATGHTGIKAVHLGTGDLTLTDSGSVTGNGTGSADHGIHAHLSASGTNLSVTAGSVTGAISGIIADNDGSGTTTVVATGNVVGNTSFGIHAENVSGAGAVSVTASGATGETFGVQVVNNASGTTTRVTTTGDVVGKGNHGIDVTLSANLGDITISTAAVTGKLSAIKAEHAGDANITIRTSGRVAASDANEHGIEATLAGPSGDDAVASGTISIVVASEVVGGSGSGRGIMATSDGRITNITLNSGAVVRAASGVAIETGDGSSTVTINEGGRISGNVRLGRGVDIVSFDGGTLGAVIFDGGEETTNEGVSVDVSKDVFNFNRGTFDITSAQFNNFEQFNIKDFATVTINGARTLTADDFSITGTIMMVDSVADDSLVISGNMDGGGTVQIDADLFSGRVDTLRVTGNVTGTTTIRVTDISQRFGTGQQNNIQVVRVGGTVNASNFQLHNGSIISGSYQYLLNFNANNKTFNLIGKSIAAPTLLVAPIAFFDGFARAPSLHQRRTDRYFVGDEGETSTRGGWSRLINGNFAYGNAQNERAEYDSDATGFQLGYDFAEVPVEGGSWVYGITSQYNEVKAGVKIDEFRVGGTMTATGYGIGATATYYNINGAYVDIQAQYNNITADFPTSTLGLLMNGVESTAMVFSMELGQRYRVNDQVALVSHGQVAWGQVDTDDFVTEQSQKVAFGADGGLTARIGMGAEYHDKRYSGFVLANFFYDAFNEWNVAYDDETVFDTVGSTEVELNFGGAMNVDENSAFFVQAGYRTSIEGGDGERSSTNFSTGMRWSW